MTAKGETYTRISVDLQRWALDFMRINNLKRQRELADRIHTENGNAIHPGRINEIIKGRGNTMKNLQLIVTNIYSGDYLAMGQYALDKKGNNVLRYLAFQNTLDELQLKTSEKIHLIFQEALREKKYDKIEEAIKLLKS